eukprot:Em0001g1696a
MSRNRYDEIQSCLQFGTFSDEQLLENPWLPVQCFIDGFNATRVKYVNPGTYLLIDEIMSPWLGLDADYAMNGVPHRTKMERKPKGIGVELKAVCDCMSSIMMQLEICEGALHQSQKKYEDQYGSGTAVTLRMTSSWHGKAHIVVGDSAFSSVATAAALKQNGTYFVGIVKTASKMYPKQFMQTHHFEERGAHIALSATVQCNKVFAVSWLDGKRKDLVSTCETTLPASPAQCTRQQVVVSSTSGVKTRPYIRYTPRCNIVASFFDNFHNIHVHDHLRQGVLKLEQHWLTKNWVHRLFATLIGVVATDCYFASKLLYPHQMSELPFLQYIDKLAFQLINNELYSGRCTRSSTGSEASSIIRPAIHTLKPIHTLPEYSKKQNEKRRMSTENLLRGLHFTYAYVDDVLIASGSLVKHVDRIRQVLQYFHDQGVVINPAKCKFGASELIGMASCPLEEKVAVVRNFPRPTTCRKLQELLGLVNLYHRFIPHCATILCCWV